MKEPAGLGRSMHGLLTFVWGQVRSIPPTDRREDHHCEIMHRTADRFLLWSPESTAPVWLSRIVAGVITDVDSGEEFHV